MSITDRMLQLYEQGYEPIPISGKVPVFEGWTKMDINPDVIPTWELIYGFGSVGVRTGEVLGLDLDILDLGVVKKLMKWVESEIGEFCFRVGQSPKVLIPVRLPGGCRKRRTVLADDDGEEHAVEVLGIGQQFVVDGVHPGTGGPYKWFNGDLYGVGVEELPEVGEEFLISLMKKFIEISGWKLKGRNVGGCVGSGSDLERFQRPVGLSEEEISRLIGLIDEDDYDTWYQVGMAIKKELPGVEGLVLFDEYSQRGAYAGADVVEKFWEGFNPVAITGRALYKFAGEEVRPGSDDGEKGPNLLIDACSSLDALIDVCGGELSKEGDKWQYIGLIQGKAKELCGERPTKPVVKGWLQRKSNSAPKWAKGWCFLSNPGMMFNIKKRNLVKVPAFDMMVAHNYGDAKGAAAELRTENLIPVYHEMGYYPGKDKVYEYQGLKFVNTAKVWPIESGDHNGDIFEGHAEKQFGADGSWLIDYLAYCYQNPGKKCVWCVLLQGVEGDGKTFWKELMSAAMGQENVKDVTQTDIERPYTDWYVGAAFSVMEEIRFSGKNRSTIMERLKAPISNKNFSVSPIYNKSYQAINVTNYLMLTNHMDALPIDENSRRYVVMYSNYQTEKALESKEYYAELYGALKDVANIRKFLGSRDTSRIDPNLKPDLIGTARMIEEAKSEYQLDVEDVLMTLPEIFTNTLLKTAIELKDLEYNSKKIPSILKKLGYRRGRETTGDRSRTWARSTG